MGLDLLRPRIRRGDVGSFDLVAVMTLLDSFDAAIEKLKLARAMYEKGGIAMSHFDLSRCHQELHTLDALIIAELLRNGKAQ